MNYSSWVRKYHLRADEALKCTRSKILTFKFLISTFADIANSCCRSFTLPLSVSRLLLSFFFWVEIKYRIHLKLWLHCLRHANRRHRIASILHWSSLAFMFRHQRLSAQINVAYLHHTSSITCSDFFLRLSVWCWNGVEKKLQRRPRSEKMRYLKIAKYEKCLLVWFSSWRFSSAGRVSSAVLNVLLLKRWYFRKGMVVISLNYKKKQ